MISGMAAEEPKIMRKIEGLLPRAPADWPWGLPHFYCAETVSEPGAEVVAYSATADGAGEARFEFVVGRTRACMVAYWRGVYAVVASKLFQKRANAEEWADRLFRIKPIRYRVSYGEIVRVNEAISITGEWPEPREFLRLRDPGVFCAFLYGEARAAGCAEGAERFKPGFPGWHWTPRIMNCRLAAQIKPFFNIQDRKSGESNG